MSIQSDLQALEQHAGVIDPMPDATLSQSRDGLWWDHQSDCSVCLVTALDIRTGQAMRWLTAWCEDNGRSFRLSYSPLMVAKYRIEVRGGGGCVIFNGGSVAVVLAAVIAELEEAKGGDSPTPAYRPPSTSQTEPSQAAQPPDCPVACTRTEQSM